MSYKQMGLVELISAIQKKVESKTELRCFDAVPENEPSPFYYAQVVAKRPAHSKTMWRGIFTGWIHSIAKPGEASGQIYELILLFIVCHGGADTETGGSPDGGHRTPGRV